MPDTARLLPQRLPLAEGSLGQLRKHYSLVYFVLVYQTLTLSHPRLEVLSFTHKSPTPQKEGARLKIPVVAVPTEADLPELTPLTAARAGFAKQSGKVAVTQKKPVLDV